MTTITISVPENKLAFLKEFLDKIGANYENNQEKSFDKQMTQEEFQQWIEEAENAPKMSLETFRKKWKLETQKIQQLIP